MTLTGESDDQLCPNGEYTNECSLASPCAECWQDEEDEAALLEAALIIDTAQEQ